VLIGQGLSLSSGKCQWSWKPALCKQVSPFEKCDSPSNAGLLQYCAHKFPPAGEWAEGFESVINPNDDEDSRRIDFAWKAHANQGEWAAKVDFKASILLASQVGLLIVAGALVSSRDLTTTPLANVFGFIGVAFLVASGVAAAGVIYPILANSKTHEVDLLYFGHVRLMSDEELIRGIQKMSSEQEWVVLARQLTRMSKGNWRKHRLLQLSIWLMGAAVLFGCIALILAR